MTQDGDAHVQKSYKNLAAILQAHGLKERSKDWSFLRPPGSPEIIGIVIRVPERGKLIFKAVYTPEGKSYLGPISTPS